MEFRNGVGAKHGPMRRQEPPGGASPSLARGQGQPANQTAETTAEGRLAAVGRLPAARRELRCWLAGPYYDGATMRQDRWLFGYCDCCGYC